MRKLTVGICLLMLASSCGGGQKQVTSTESPSGETDSLAVVADTAEVDIAVEEPWVPPMADESFADFIYNFALDEKLQRTRIVFPLPYYMGNEKKHIEKDEWEYDPLFSRLDFYTVIFDQADDMDIEKDTVATSAKVEWIYLDRRKVKRYYFERLKGAWMLEAIDYADMPAPDAEHEDFYDFYRQFAGDSVFQATRLAEPLKFVTADPDDEFEILETTLEPGQWFAFQPVLPCDYLTNVNYGQSSELHSRTKVIEMKGFGNGFNNTLYFERRGNLWKLRKFEDLSD